MFTLNASKSCKAIVGVDPYRTKPLFKVVFLYPIAYKFE